MEIGNEISQKIRSAIKAKLVDLGVYVDDELPDYIMVMVANKKSQDQMTEDLNLFLGNNTEKFTSWLHSLLTKLQSITADQPKQPEASSVPLITEGVTAAKEAPEEEEDALLIGPEHDDFEEEANREAAAAAATKTLTTTQTSMLPPQRSIVTSQAVSTVKRSETRSFTRESSRVSSVAHSSSSSMGSRMTSHESTRKREHSPRHDVRSRLGPSSSRDLEKSRSASALTRQRATVRKRRAPESIVGSIVRHDVEEEEEYDPRRPLIGRVASTVKVGERRPTVPPGQQANKSLLLKAMTEARDSIAKATQKLTEQVALENENEREASRRSVAERMKESEEPSRSGSNSRRYGTRQSRHRIEPRGTMRSSGSSQPITRVPPQPVPRHQSETNGRSVELYSRSKREEVLQQFRAGDSDSEETSHTAAPDELPPRAEATMLDDNRQIHVSSNEDSAMEEPTEERTISIGPAKTEPETSYTEEDVLDTLIESGADESDFTDEDTEARIVKHEEPVEERAPSPKFVVTLDGVDPSSMASESMDMDDSELEMEAGLPKQNIVRVAPQRITTSTPVSMDFNQLDQFVDDESGVSPPKRGRIPERCKFWLACRNGNQCPYHHPSIPCKMFPKCKFGDKCLYIHPNCRFDANCTRANCPFTHATKRPGPASTGPLSVVIQPVNVVAAPPFRSLSTPTTPTTRQAPATCKFFPKCTNMNCKFMHPKPCRYGLACRDKEACTYTHPELPPANKLKWKAPAVSRSLSDSGSSLR